MLLINMHVTIKVVMSSSLVDI